MKKYTPFFIGLLLLFSCNDSVKKETSSTITTNIKDNYKSFGNKIIVDEIDDIKVVTNKYKDLKEGDTLAITFSSTVKSVCKAKGCWMRVTLDKDTETMVKFKDYGFFVPKDIENDTVVIQGKAFVSEVSVEEQRHFASDAGKTEEEIANITVPKKTYSFIANGVLIKK
ncbi:DUF4920 domain-containing protein [Aquimarina muelleri]|uniref:DUF4920 domain-containing protein n=1 Tax=Aquimarina muelleri TaxID=279356 RepID=UPI003F682BBB